MRHVTWPLIVLLVQGVVPEYLEVAHKAELPVCVVLYLPSQHVSDHLLKTREEGLLELCLHLNQLLQFANVVENSSVANNKPTEAQLTF